MLARVLTAAVGIPLMLYVACVDSPWPLRVFGALLTLLIYFEFRAAGQSEYRPPISGGMSVVVLLFFVGTRRPNLGTDPLDFIYFLIILLLCIVCWKRVPIMSEAFLFVCLAVGAVMLLGIKGVLDPDTTGIGSLAAFRTSALLLFFLTIWAGDTAAMLFGKLFGRNKLAPNISPNKTWEGSIANLLAASCVGYFLAHLGELSPVEGLGVGAISGSLGQVGDLVESAWKRRVGIKDSGSLLPGHGGVLDRFDSMLFAAPFVALFLSLIR